MHFQNTLISWYNEHKRELPWRDTKDPYVIWLSEIIMQQTRVAQGLPYFNRFLSRFPTVGHFASATESEILKLWQGLGYYSRGRNMLATAIQVVREFNGEFPTQYETLRKLKGVGPYTAAAIASFSSSQPVAVVDGNVFRLLSRYFGVSSIIDSSAGKHEFQHLAQTLIEGFDSSVYNQAIMEFGALVCKPHPDCQICPLASGCYALKHNLIRQLPARKEKPVKRIRHFNYFICSKNGKILMQLRPSGDIWQGLYDFPLIESESDELDNEEVQQLLGSSVRLQLLNGVKHLLTHQTIFIRFFEAEDYIFNFKPDQKWEWIDVNTSEFPPVPIAIDTFISAFLTKSGTCQA